MSRINVPGNYQNLNLPDYDKINDPKKRWDVEDRPEDVKQHKNTTKQQKASYESTLANTKRTNQDFMAKEVSRKNANFVDGFSDYLRGQMIPSSAWSYYTNSDGDLNLDRWTSIYDDFNPHQIDSLMSQYNENLPKESQIVLSQVKNSIHNEATGIRNDANVMRMNFLADWEIMNKTSDNPYPLRDLFKNMEGDPRTYDVWWDKVYGSDFDNEDWADLTSGLGYDIDNTGGGNWNKNVQRFSNKPIWNNPYLQSSMIGNISSNVEDFKTTQTGWGVNKIDVDEKSNKLQLKDASNNILESYDIKYDKSNSRPYIIIPRSDNASDIGFNVQGADPNASRKLYIDNQALNEYEVFDMSEASAGDYAAYSAGDVYDYESDWGDWSTSDDNREMQRDRRGWRQPNTLGELISMSYGHGGHSPFKTGASAYGSRTKWDDPEAYNWRDIID